jgi:hypothetical protein
VTVVAAGPSRLDDEGLRRTGVEVLHGFEAALAHLADEGQRYGSVLVCGLEQTSRYLAPVRAYAPQATLVCDAADSLVRAGEGAEAGPRERSARVAAACTDVILVETSEEREAVLGLAAGAPIEVIPRPSATGLAAILARARRPAPGAGATGDAA